MSTSTSTVVGARGRVGDRAPRPDGVPKVTGTFTYASDLHRDGMLHGATLRSPISYARIRSIDFTRALVTPGVVAVLLAADMPGKNRFGLNFDDQPVLAEDVVRYAGEPIAVVAARSRAGGPGRRQGHQARPRAPRGRVRHGAGHGAGRAAAARVRQRAAPCPSSARRPRHRRRRRLGGGLLRDGHAGPGRPRTRGGAGGAGRGRRGRPIRHDAMAARRPGADRPVPRPARGQGQAAPGRRGRRLRVARGHPHAGPRLRAGVADRSAGQVLLRARGVLPRARPPPPVAHLDAARRDARRAAGGGRRPADLRRRRLRLFVPGRGGQRRDLRRRALRGAQRPRGGHGRLHQQPSVRRDAGVRRAPGVLRPRGPDGQAGPGARRRPGASCACATLCPAARSCRPARSCGAAPR